MGVCDSAKGCDGRLETSRALWPKGSGSGDSRCFCAPPPTTEGERPSKPPRAVAVEELKRPRSPSEAEQVRATSVLRHPSRSVAPTA
eukprot:scaffold101569_cov28-Tisochrysis_lutea.AAC.1